MTARVPPDQIVTAKFPIVGERAPTPEALDLAAWRLTIDGLVERPLQLGWGDFLALPHEALRTDVHCVTRWTRFDTVFEGVPLARLLRPRPAARFVRFEAYSARGHDTSLPLDVALAHTWLVHRVDGAPLTVEHGFPLRTVTTGRYFYKSLKWLRRVEVLADDRLGYWEREDGYHNGADPWPGDQRYVGGNLDDKALERLRAAGDFSSWRGRTVRSADLRGWRPRALDLRGVQLKNCDLRGARLEGADLAGANLTLCDLRGASLAGANLRGADLEGARLTGADLSGADLRDTFLTAAELARDGEPPARLDGARFEGATGLLDDTLLR